MTSSPPITAHQPQQTPRVLPLAVGERLGDGLDVVQDRGVPVVQPRYLTSRALNICTD